MTLRVGLVCPYSWSATGGVQVHIADFAEELWRRGHEPSILAPADAEDEVGDGVVWGGRPVAVPYNGSVARLTFGPVSAGRVHRWLSSGRFDVVHVHQPDSPSLSILTVWAADDPLVGTWHMASERSRAMVGFSGILRPSLEKIEARIAVSEAARTTLVNHLGGDPVLIPNGVHVERYAAARPRSDYQAPGGTVSFLGRLDEPRKGLPVLLAAWPEVVRRRPQARLLVAGPGDIEEAEQVVPDEVRNTIRWLGRISDHDKAVMLASSDIYVGPHTGGESFGIVLVEAMAAGVTVVASDLPAFRAVLAEGEAGRTFPTGDSTALAAELLHLLASPEERERLRVGARRQVTAYDWSTVTDQVLEVYDLVLGSGTAHRGAAQPARGRERTHRRRQDRRR
jgi:phosphatidylinositol alpha-mannosyltransferase